MKSKILLWMATMAVFALQACQEEEVPVNASEERLAQQEQTIEQYLADNNITATKDTNRYYYRVLNEAPQGRAPQPNDVVGIYYHFTTLDGKLIDEKIEGQDTIAKYVFDNGSVVLPIALDSMINKMKEGETYEFYLPFHAAYANYSMPNVIPENAIVKASIKLAQVLNTAEEKQAEKDTIFAYLSRVGITQADTLADGVYYTQTQAGTGDSVKNGDQISVRYTGSLLNGTEFDSNVDSDSPLQFIVGQASFITGFQAAITQMQKGEKGTVFMVSSAGYGSGIIAIPYAIIGDLLDTGRLDRRTYSFARDIPPLSILKFDLEIEPSN